MGITVNANGISVVTAGSNGVAQSFPDACKTPTPGGPVPIPYPNVAMSSDTADGSTTVKIDGNPAMTQGANFSTSTGDEAGSAQGVVSNKIKGKAEPVNQSMDVKIDGKGAFRLTDPMTSNVGASPNAANPAVVNPPVVGMIKTSDACKDVKEKKKAQAKGSTSWGKSGIVDPHRPIIQSVATDLKVILFFRATNPDCGKWILQKHAPKTCAAKKGKTTSGGTADKVQAWLDEFFFRMTPAQQEAYPLQTSLMATNRTYSLNGSDYVGIVGIPEGAGNRPEKGRGTGQSGADYSNKWMTGDYDLFQILESGEPCKEVCQTLERFAQIQKAINKGCGWDAIQHGPQAQWEPDRHDIPDESIDLFKMPVLVKAVLRGELPINHRVPMAKTRAAMPVMDENVTQVAGNGVVALESQDDLKKALICRECEK